MITVLLTHLAILTSVPFPLGLIGLKFDAHAGKKIVAKAEEKVVLVDRPFAEKCVVRSELPTWMQGKSTSLNWNLESIVSNLDSVFVYVATHNGELLCVRCAYEPVPKRFDKLISKAGPNVVNETGRAGEVIAKKLNLNLQTESLSSEIEGTAELRSGIKEIGADLGLKDRISKLTHGWQRTFQLPIEWDDSNLQIIQRNESKPVLDENVPLPLPELEVSSNKFDKSDKFEIHSPKVDNDAIFSYWIGFNH